MAKVERFEDLIAWQKARVLTREIYNVTRQGTFAKASCAEVRSQLYIALDVGYLVQADFDRLLSLAEEVGRITGGLRASVARQRDEQRKTHQ